MARKKKDDVGEVFVLNEPKKRPSFEVEARQYVRLVFPGAARGFAGERVDFGRNLTREEARALADALAIEANKINA